MTSGEAPAVARRRLRFALRKARDAKGLTQQQVAHALDWSLSKVNRIEQGEVTISLTDLRAALELFGVTDPAVVNQLVEDARAARRRGWWDEQRYRENLTGALLQVIQFESEATIIRSFAPTLLPGPLQTPAYAKSIMDFWRDELPAEVRTVRAEVRTRRRESVLNSADPPKYLFVVVESVLSHSAGGPRVLAEQLRLLLELMERTEFKVRVVSSSEAPMIAMLGPFALFDLGEEENAALYREALFLDEILYEGEAIRRYRGYFEQLWTAALAEDASKQLIEARLAAVEAAPARPGAGEAQHRS